MTIIIRTTLTIALLAACTLTTWRAHTHHDHPAACAGPAILAAPHPPDAPAPTVKPPDVDVPHAWAPPEPPDTQPADVDTSADTHKPTPTAPSG